MIREMGFMAVGAKIGSKGSIYEDPMAAPLSLGSTPSLIPEKSTTQGGNGSNFNGSVFMQCPGMSVAAKKGAKMTPLLHFSPCNTKLSAESQLRNSERYLAKGLAEFIAIIGEKMMARIACTLFEHINGTGRV